MATLNQNNQIKPSPLISKPSPPMAKNSSSTLAPGFRFHPTDEELLIYYLKRKLLNRPLLIDAMSTVNLYNLEPWDLPALAKLQTKDQQWFFFCPLDRKNNCSQPRTNRATPRGYWKTTGKDREVLKRDGEKSVAGMKKTLVYHEGRAPKGHRTKWVMHEYKLLDDKLVSNGVCLDGLVVCRIFEKKGAGHQIGAQYGAPVTEEQSEEEKEEQEKDKEEEGEEELIQVPIQKANIGNPIYPQLSNPIENMNGANIAQIHQEPDIFNGLDEISNQELNINTFFEMNDLSTNLTANLPNYPSALNSEILPGPDSFFDSLDDFNFNTQTENQIFPNQNQNFWDGNQNQNFADDEFSTFFDAVDSNSLSNNSNNNYNNNNNNSPLDDMLQNYEGLNGNYSGLSSIENVEISNSQDLIPNPVPYSPLSKRLISLLDSYNSPPAFASEKPLKLNASSASNKKSTKVNSMVSKVLRGVLCVAIVLTAGCKLAICIGGR